MREVTGWQMVFVAVILVVRAVVIVAERLTEPPIMRKRINRGSDEFFEWEARHRGEMELDEVLDPSRHRMSGGQPTAAHASGSRRVCLAPFSTSNSHSQIMQRRPAA
jgi:hypothetical protein